MRASELRDLTDIELAEHLGTARRELFGLRFQHATGELDNTAGLKWAKREIARALTVARERGIETNGGRKGKLGAPGSGRLFGGNGREHLRRGVRLRRPNVGAR